MNIIDGKKAALDLRESLKKEIGELRTRYGDLPGLAVVQVGDVAASSVYVKAKTKAAKEVGIEVFDYHLNENVTEEELLKLVDELNSDEKVNGILVQLPLPSHINEDKILESILPEKDADGFHPLNIGKLSLSKYIDESLLIPCTPNGALILLKNLKVTLAGKNALVVGRSNIVGKPMAQLLLKESCTVTIAHSKTINLKDLCKNADIVVAAIGKANFIKGDWIKEGAIVLDVGINRIEENINGNIKKSLVGDVEFNEASKKASAITPVPGGIGPMTIACLLKNTSIAYKNKKIEILK